MVLFFLFPVLSLCQVPQRFPRPDFQTDYTLPDLLTPAPRATVLEYIDIGVLVVALALATYLAHKQRSRRNIFLLMVFSLVYFGFYVYVIGNDNFNIAIVACKNSIPLEVQNIVEIVISGIDQKQSALTVTHKFFRRFI